MPTTTTIDTTLSINAIGARTDFAGTAVDDISAEEFRFNNKILTEGILTPNTAFQVLAGGGGTMDVIVGSGAAKTDYALVDGNISGQGDYLVRLDEVNKTITLSAPDAVSDRTDEIYLVVLDDTYDASTFALPVLAVREGDVGGGAPGPDSSWESYMLLASVLVPGGSADITAATITDERSTAESILPLQDGVYEVDNSTEVASQALTASFADVASVTLSIPAGWNSWKCEAWASYVAGFSSGADASEYETVIRIDGADQQVKSGMRLSITSGSTPTNKDGAIGGRRTGLTTTGSRSVSLRAREINNDVQLRDIYLYARAVRTS